MRCRLMGFLAVSGLLLAPATQGRAFDQIAWMPVVNYDFTIYFDPASTALTPDARAVLGVAAADALGYGVTRVVVTGHADRTGGASYNQDLSMRRALAARDTLVAQGVPAALIVIRAVGELEPPITTADGIAEPQNRRVDILLVP